MNMPGFYREISRLSKKIFFTTSTFQKLRPLCRTWDSTGWRMQSRYSFDQSASPLRCVPRNLSHKFLATLTKRTQEGRLLFPIPVLAKKTAIGVLCFCVS